MVMDWFGYSIDFPRHVVGAVRCSARSCSGGAAGRSSSAASPRSATGSPGMMLLISMAITVAYVASLATSLGWLDLEFWWELAALVTIMLLGHWQEMKAIGQAQGALAALAALLPDEAELVDGDDDPSGCSPRRAARRRRRAGAPGRPCAGRRCDRRRRGRARRVDDHRRVPAGRQDGSATGSSPARCRPTPRSGCGSTPSATTPRWPASSGWSPTRRPANSRAQVLADRFAALLFYVAAARRRSSRSSCGGRSATSTTRSCARSPCW